MRKAWLKGLLIGFLVLLSLPSRAEPPPDAHRITVSAVHEVTPLPDQARLSLAVERNATTANQAAGQVADASQKVIAAIREHLAKEDEVVTKRYRLDPQYRPRQPRDRASTKREITGYRAYNEVQVTTSNLEGIGVLIDAAVAAGANRIAGLVFQVADRGPYEREALEKAAKKASMKARAIAGALGVKLGPLAEATSQPMEFPVPRSVMNTGMVQALAETPVLPGKVTIRGSVRLSYEIRQ